MRISATNQNNIYPQNQKQNMNFGSMTVLGGDIPRFKQICPDAVSLSDFILRICDHGTGIIETLVREITGKTPSNSQKLQDVFLTPAQEQLFEDDIIKISGQISKVAEEDKKNFFLANWVSGTGAIGTVKARIIKFRQPAPLTEAQIEASMPQVRATQADFFAKHSK